MTLRFFLRVVPAWAFAAAAVLACQGQGEGAPCSADNNTSGDCQTGLTCMSVPNVVGTRCCPASGGSSSPDCTGTTGLANANVPPQGDSGMDGSLAPDSSASTDAPAEATPEASASEAGTADGTPEATATDAPTETEAAAPTDAPAESGEGGD